VSAAIAVQHGTESEQPAGDWPITLVAISTFGLVRSQAESMPFLQNQDAQQLMVNGTTTRSPTLRLVTSDPSSIISPMFSWPRISPDSIVGW